MKKDTLKIHQLKSAAGLELSVLNFGATITSLKLPLSKGMHEVILNYPDINHYLDDQFYLGATIGRYANRIADASFTIGDKKAALTANNNSHILHGGYEGFNRKYWHKAEQNTHKLTLAHTSPCGDQGFPGNLKTSVTFKLINNQIIIDYFATCDQVTHVNLTNHSYFNLDLQQTTIDTHSFQINANRITATDINNIPTGKIIDISGTELDFKNPTLLKNAAPLWPTTHQRTQGYDHNYALNNPSGDCQFAALACSAESGITMKVYTTKPGLQFYTGNHLAKPFSQYQGFCFEPQFFPDTPNHPHFPSSILLPMNEYHHRQIIEFDW